MRYEALRSIKKKFKAKKDKYITDSFQYSYSIISEIN
jgi:hypothetical protein